MTAVTSNHGWAKAGIHSINHFAIAVPDLDEETKFLQTFGLRVVRHGDVLHVRASASEHVWARIIQADVKAVAFVSVGCYAEDYDQICHQVGEAGGMAVSPHPAGSVDGFWFEDPHGMLVQLRVAPKLMPDEKAAMPSGNVPAGIQGAAFRSSMAGAVPRRLAHLLFFTPDVKRSVDFYERALGVKVADRSADIVAFTYARHGCDHHLLAFFKSHAKGIHHSAWDVDSIEQVGLGSSRMRQAGYDLQWGVGRHVLGSNYFNYVRDTSGTWWEHSCHIDYIPAGMPWDGGDHHPDNSLYLWGPDVPPEFSMNTEA
jgi:catechol 2,3-dioxygenase-like lactoylglutathione lyase family enzyme